MKIIECRSDYIFIVEDLLSGERNEVHGRRLKLFRNKDYNVTQEVLDHLQYQQGELLVIKEFHGIRKIDGQVELLVEWKGFTDSEKDWVAYPSLKEDVPELVQEYIDELKQSGSKQEKTLAASI